MTENADMLHKIDKTTQLFSKRQLSKEEYARKGILNGCSAQTEISSLRVTIRSHSASLMMLNSYPRNGTVNPCLTTIKDYSFYTCIFSSSAMNFTIR